MGAHSWDELLNPVQFMVMATAGCFVGHIFMYPLGLYELSGSIGGALSEVFNVAADPSVMDADALINSFSASEPTTHSFAPHLESAHNGTIQMGEAGFEECVAEGGATHHHGPDVVCHEPH